MGSNRGEKNRCVCPDVLRVGSLLPMVALWAQAGRFGAVLAHTSAMRSGAFRMRTKGHPCRCMYVVGRACARVPWRVPANIAQGKPPYLGIPDQFKEVLEQLDANENDGGIPSSDATARKPAGPGSARSASGTPPPAQPIRTPASSVYAAPRGRDSPPRSNGARPRHLPPHLSGWCDPAPRSGAHGPP